MTPLQTAARFAAFVWYTENRNGSRRIVKEEARRFAQDHWQAFLPVANEGLGRLLLRIKTPRQGHGRRQPGARRSAKRQLTAA